MANGEPFNPSAMTAASWDFPLGSQVKISCGDRSVVVTITDRGPAPRVKDRGRIIDLSRGAFEKLAPLAVGVITVKVELLDAAGSYRPRRSHSSN
jgi:rare lipoprotein A